MAKLPNSSAIVGLKDKGIELVDDTQPEIDVRPANEYLMDEAALEKFMQEPVTVLIMSTTDGNAPPYADISVNGAKVVIRRNVPTPIKRMHLEVLARMKETRIVQGEVEPNRAIGIESLRGFTANCYPFTVIEDKNPRGGAWLASILAEPA